MYTEATDVGPALFKDFDKTKARLYFQKHAGYLGAILGRYNFQWTRDIDTACISPTTLYWNPEFYEKMDKETNVTILAHELWHPGLMHHVAIGKRDPLIWNYAGDYVINNFLKKNGFYMDGFGFLLNDMFENELKWGTVDVYDYLATLDQNTPILSKGGSPEESLDGDVVPGDGSDQEIAEAVQTASQARALNNMSSSTKAGDLPAEIVTLINKFYESHVPWEKALMNHFSAKIEPVRSYSKINRRYDDFLLPSTIANEGLENLCFAIDASGSITKKQGKVFFSEGKFVHDTFQPELMTFFTFDTLVKQTFELHQGQEYDSFEITGGGGTSLVDLYEKVSKINPNCLVIFTDLYVDIPPEPSFEVIWIVLDNDDAKVPYGTLYTFNTKRWTD